MRQLSCVRIDGKREIDVILHTDRSRLAAIVCAARVRQGLVRKRPPGCPVQLGGRLHPAPYTREQGIEDSLSLFKVVKVPDGFTHAGRMVAVERLVGTVNSAHV
jgi:hypothetical protein